MHFYFRSVTPADRRDAPATSIDGHLVDPAYLAAKEKRIVALQLHHAAELERLGFRTNEQAQPGTSSGRHNARKKETK